jgi:hypothetical protein
MAFGKMENGKFNVKLEQQHLSINNILFCL